jgi:DNA invertase Pin-like site-specific DNA recombinase
MNIFGYIRVSTDKQELRNQEYIILQYANKNSLGNIDILSETVSGKISWEKRELAQLVEKIDRGDILIVSELSRLGRSMLEIFEMISILLRKAAAIHVVKGNLILKDDIQSKVFAFAFSLGAEIERDLISQRTKEALQYRKKKGKTLGRPTGSWSSKLDKETAQIVELRKKKVSIASIAKIYNVGATTVRSFCLSRGI